MRAVAQRVSQARIGVAGETVGEMGHGILALIGVAMGDERSDAEAMARKLCRMRIFDDEQGRMNRSLVETGGTLGVVSSSPCWRTSARGSDLRGARPRRPTRRRR